MCAFYKSDKKRQIILQICSRFRYAQVLSVKKKSVTVKRKWILVFSIKSFYSFVSHLHKQIVYYYASHGHFFDTTINFAKKDAAMIKKKELATLKRLGYCVLHSSGTFKMIRAPKTIQTKRNNTDKTIKMPIGVPQTQHMKSPNKSSVDDLPFDA